MDINEIILLKLTSKGLAWNHKALVNVTDRDAALAFAHKSLAEGTHDVPERKVGGERLLNALFDESLYPIQVLSVLKYQFHFKLAPQLDGSSRPIPPSDMLFQKAARNIAGDKQIVAVLERGRDSFRRTSVALTKMSTLLGTLAAAGTFANLFAVYPSKIVNDGLLGLTVGAAAKWCVQHVGNRLIRNAAVSDLDALHSEAMPHVIDAWIAMAAGVTYRNVELNLGDGPLSLTDLPPQMAKDAAGGMIDYATGKNRDRELKPFEVRLTSSGLGLSGVDLVITAVPPEPATPKPPRWLGPVDSRSRIGEKLLGLLGRPAVGSARSLVHYPPP